MSFQRMVLISQASYNELKYSQPPNDQQHILERPDIPDDEKQMVYLNNWGMKKKSLVTTSQNIPDFDKWMELIPDRYKKNAKFLIQQMTSVLSWDRQGTVLVNNTELPNTNIIDVINYIIRERKKPVPPIGWNIIAPLVENLNLPKEIIGNPRLFNRSEITPKKLRWTTN